MNHYALLLDEGSKQINESLGNRIFTLILQQDRAFHGNEEKIRLGGWKAPVDYMT